MYTYDWRNFLLIYILTRMNWQCTLREREREKAKANHTSRAYAMRLENKSWIAHRYEAYLNHFLANKWDNPHPHMHLVWFQCPRAPLFSVLLLCFSLFSQSFNYHSHTRTSLAVLNFALDFGFSVWIFFSSSLCKSHDKAEKPSFYHTRGTDVRRIFSQIFSCFLFIFVSDMINSLILDMLLLTWLVAAAAGAAVCAIFCTQPFNKRLLWI